MELYRNALRTLVHDRDADRNVPSSADSELSLGDKLVILRDLAWRLSDNHRSEIDLDRAAKYVSAKLRAMRHLDVLDGDQVLEQLRHRSGILRSPAEGRMDFVHRTFQEYLAAEEAAEEDRIGNLIGRAHLDLWRETIIMVAGHSNTRQREELLDGILDRAEGEPRHARRLRLLAAACQETLPSVSDGLADRLEQAVTELLPACRRTDPPALAAVGTSLLRWLPTSLGELTQNSAAQTVKTVALIGGEEGLQKLKGYVGDDRSEVVKELVEAWNYFDADAYVEAVLSKLSLDGRDVYISHSGQLHAASRLRSMSSAHVECSMQGLEILAEFPPLDALWVSSLQGEVDLSVLEGHPDLERLLLFSDCLVTGASVLSNLTKLSWLALPVRGYPDLKFLDALPHLRFLSISGTSTSTDLSPVSGLGEVGNLHVVGAGEISGFDEIESMSALRHIFVYGKDVRSWIEKVKSIPPSFIDLHLHQCVVPSQRDAFAKFGDNVRLTACRSIDGAEVFNVGDGSAE